jgi:hypothetical protein
LPSVIVDGELHKWPDDTESGVRDDDIQPTEVPERLCDGVFDVPVLRDIACHCKCSRALSRQILREGREPVEPAPSENHGGAPTGVLSGESLADAGRCTGNQDDLAL